MSALRLLPPTFLALSLAQTCAQANPAELPGPSELSSCARGDPVAVMVGGVATKLGGEVLGCFVSGKRVMLQSATKTLPGPLEHAFAIGLPGGPYTSADLDKLLSRVTEQWKGFDPLGKEFEKYKDRVNELMKGVATGPTPTLSSVKPVLVSIDRLGPESYSVVSVRSYVVDVSGEHVSTTSVIGDAVVLQGAQLVRLTIQRVLTDPSDVAELQGEIAQWARAVAASPSDTDRGMSDNSQTAR